MEGWFEDVLGPGFERFEIALGSDDEGDLVATLVRSLPRRRSLWQFLRGVRRPLENVDVLYVHGWNDYFFQKSVAEFFTSRGARFYALDLRKFGRSLREGQTHGYIEDLASYDAEIGLALQLMGHPLHAHNLEEAQHQQGAPAGGRGSSRRLLLHGHSAGGLILSLWADRHRGVADGLLLNSPWLALQVGGPVRRALASVVSLRAWFAPHDLALPQLDLGFYRDAQLRVSNAEEQASINREWRSDQSPPVRAGWLRAILEGHAAINAGIDVGAPVCVQLSDHTLFGIIWRDEMMHADTVIDVKKVSLAALKLGTDVTVQRIPGALHNVFMSAEDAARHAYEGVERWLLGWAAAGSLPPTARPEIDDIAAGNGGSNRAEATRGTKHESAARDAVTRERQVSGHEASPADSPFATD